MLIATQFTQTINRLLIDCWGRLIDYKLSPMGPALIIITMLCQRGLLVRCVREDYYYAVSERITTTLCQREFLLRCAREKGLCQRQGFEYQTCWNNLKQVWCCCPLCYSRCCYRQCQTCSSIVMTLLQVCDEMGVLIFACVGFRNAQSITDLGFSFQEINF